MVTPSASRAFSSLSMSKMIASSSPTTAASVAWLGLEMVLPSPPQFSSGADILDSMLLMTMIMIMEVQEVEWI